MKKRVVSCLLLCLAALILVAGCSSKNAAQNPQTSGANTTANQRQNPDVFGQVKAISGSDITIDLAQMPQRNQNQTGQQQPPAQQQTQSTNQSSGTSKGQGQRPNMTLQLTGESKTVTVPDTAKIYGGGGPRVQNSEQAQTPQQTEIKLNDIKVGDTISVYYTAGTTTVDHVTVRSGAPQK